MNTENKNEIASATAKSIYEAHPTLWDRFGERGFLRTEEDNRHHLDHLETAYDLQDPRIFLDYSLWLQGVLNSRNVETRLIIDNFERLMVVLPGKASKAEEAFMLACLSHANKSLSKRALEGG